MGRLDIRVVEAKDLHKEMDTKVLVSLVPGPSYETMVVKKSANPQYDHKLSFNIADANTQRVKFDVIEPGTLSDRNLGSYLLSLPGLVQGEIWDTWVLLKDGREDRAELRVRICAVDFGKPPQQQHHHQQPPGSAPPPPPQVYGTYPPAPNAYPPSAYPPSAQQNGYPPSAYPPSAYPPAAYPPPPNPYGYPPQGPPAPYAYPQPVAPPTQSGLNDLNASQPLPEALGGSSGMYPPPPGMENARPGVLAPPRVGHTASPWERIGITQMEYDHLVAVFVRFDEDDSNALSHAELEKLAVYLNYAQGKEAIDRIFRDMDRDGTRTISLEEFSRWLAFNRPDPKALYGLSQTEYQEVLAQFHEADESRTGRLTKSEFCKFAQRYGWVESFAAADQLFGYINVNHPQGISLHDFLHFRSGDGKGLGLKAGTFGKHNAANKHTAEQRRAAAAADQQYYGSGRGNGGIEDPELQKFAKIDQVQQIVPQIGAERAALLLQKYEWDTERAVNAALNGEGGGRPAC